MDKQITDARGLSLVFVSCAVLLLLALCSPAQASSWRYDVATDDITDEVTHVASSRGVKQDGSSIKAHGSPGYLFMFCNPRQRYLSWHIDFDEVLGSAGEEREFVYRVTKRTAFRARGTIIRGDQTDLVVDDEDDVVNLAAEFAALVDEYNSLSFAGRMREYKNAATTAFRTIDWRGAYRQIYIHNDGSRDAIRKVFRACGKVLSGESYVAPQAAKREAVEQTGKVLDDTGAATPPAPTSRPAKAPAVRSEAPQKRSGDAQADNPLEAVGAFALDGLGPLTGNILIWS